MTAGPTSRRPPRNRRFAAARLLAHRLLRREEARGRERASAAGGSPAPGSPGRPGLETALRLVDDRLVASPRARRAAAEEGLLLCRAALAARADGGTLAGQLRTDLRVGIRRPKGGSEVVLIPTLVQHPDGEVSVVVMAPGGDRQVERRARRYRRAAAILFGGRVHAAVVAPDGTVRRLPAGGTGRPLPRG